MRSKLLFCSFLLSTVSIFNACSSDKKKEEDGLVSEDKTSASAEISVGILAVLPKEIDGCSCTFSESEADFISKKYIYAADFSRNAYILVDGQLHHLLLVKSDTLASNGAHEVYSDDLIEVNIETHQTDETDETSQEQGTLTIRDQAGRTIVKQVVGECGC